MEAASTKTLVSANKILHHSPENGNLGYLRHESYKSHPVFRIVAALPRFEEDTLSTATLVYMKSPGIEPEAP
jgi:hypothetical protein